MRRRAPTRDPKLMRRTRFCTPPHHRLFKSSDAISNPSIRGRGARGTFSITNHFGAASTMTRSNSGIRSGASEASPYRALTMFASVENRLHGGPPMIPSNRPAGTRKDRTSRPKADRGRAPRRTRPLRRPCRAIQCPETTKARAAPSSPTPHVEFLGFEMRAVAQHQFVTPPGAAALALGAILGR